MFLRINQFVASFAKPSVRSLLAMILCLMLWQNALATSTNDMLKKNKAASLNDLFAEKSTSKNTSGTQAKGFIKTDSGLQYRILKQGVGPKGKLGDTVQLHYKIWLAATNKLLFDTRKNNQPHVTILGDKKMIPGVREGILGMKAKELRTLIVPAKLAFGSRQLSKVPANSDLRVEIEMLSVFANIKIHVDRQGTGEPIKYGEYANTHYTGWLTDGTKFDSSFDHDGTFEFGLGSSQVIQGWSRGVVGMKVGEIRTITVPPNLGYGNHTRPNIPANSTLKFEIELIGRRSGVTYKIIKQGHGPPLRWNTKAKIHLKLNTLNGDKIVDTQFGKPLGLMMDPTINPPGLAIGSVGMQVDEIREMTIPKAWGVRGNTQDLWASVDLVEIFGVKQSEKSQTKSQTKSSATSKTKFGSKSKAKSKSASKPTP